MKRKNTQGELDFNAPREVSVGDFQTPQWRRLSAVVGRCNGTDCRHCNCVSDLRTLAGDALIKTINVGSSGNFLVTDKQRIGLRSGRQISVPDESTDSVFLSVDILPAPLTPCSDDEL